MEITLTTLSDLASVEGASWDELDHGASPFTEWGFLRALELSGSVGGDSGWLPNYLVARTDASCLIDDGAQSSSPKRVGSEPVVVGAVATYIKSHSFGEYIFDFHWARASLQAGVPYYPKLVIAAPVTPATGRRLLLHPRLAPGDRERVARGLIAGVREFADERGLHSIHWLFVSPEERSWLELSGLAPRASFQFHWHNRGWHDFDEFLASLNSRKRKQVRKERARARAAVDDVRFIPGSAMGPERIAALERFYRRTISLYGGNQYLRPGFFGHLIRLAGQRVLFLEATRGDRAIAGALFLETERALYGRYWGCSEQVDCLHFEVSYYAAIERCIERGTPLFEAGAQGEHKLVRGFMPVICHSAHWLRHPGVDRGVREFLREEERAVVRQVEMLADHGPYRRGTSIFPEL